VAACERALAQFEAEALSAELDREQIGSSARNVRAIDGGAE
jgi:hypothetical protein